MGIIDKLKAKFTEETKRPRAARTAADPVGLKRKKFAAYLTNQKALTENPQPSAKKKGKRQKTDFWQRQDGKYVFAPRYGTSPVILVDGKPHIAADSLEELRGYMDQLIEATGNGELDKALAAAAERKIKVNKAAKTA